MLDKQQNLLDRFEDATRKQKNIAAVALEGWREAIALACESLKQLETLEKKAKRKIILKV